MSVNLDLLLKNIAKPAQYLGNEVNVVRKDFARQDVRIALVFPDAYELGMSHMGLRILYDILNRIDGVVAERCFAPLPDFEARLRETQTPLFSLESQTPLADFDVIGFSLPYELTFTNVLNILDLAQIPLWQKDRQAHHPLILGGGTSAYNPEPLADFFDAIAIGDGEELVIDLISQVKALKQQRHIDRVVDNTQADFRHELLLALKNINPFILGSGHLSNNLRSCRESS